MQVKKISAKELEKQVASDSRDLVAVFIANWCGYSQELMRELERNAPDINLCEVDISDTEDRAWDIYGIKVVPTALYLREGKEVARKTCSLDGLRVKDLKALVASCAKPL